MNEFIRPCVFLSIQKKTIVDRENNPFDNRKGMLDEIQEIVIKVMRWGYEPGFE